MHHLVNTTALLIALDHPDARGIPCTIGHDRCVLRVAPRARAAARRSGWHALEVEVVSNAGMEKHDGPPPSSPSSRVKAFYKSQHKHAPPTILFLPTADPSTHLSRLPDDISLGDIVLPGTHQSLALHGWPFSQCQTAASTLPVQLADGIRFFDIRLRVKNGLLIAYHGPWPQRTLFPAVIDDVFTFLRAHPRETVITCIQQESPDSGPDPRFSALVRLAMEDSIARGGWFLENRIPQLGEVRGRAVLMSRFGGSARDGGTQPWHDPPSDDDSDDDDDDEKSSGFPVVRMGWRPERWPYSALDGFEWHDATGGACRTQDWCEIYGFFNIGAKFTVASSRAPLVRRHMRPELTPRVDRFPAHRPLDSLCLLLLLLLLSSSSSSSRRCLPPPALTLSFASAASLPLAPPPLVAHGFGLPSWGLGVRGVNARLREWMLDRLATGQQAPEEGRLRGIVPVDYYHGAGLVDLMVAFNLCAIGRSGTRS
ncbi:hypothetical protein NliqN6_3776 [Naganishia liquefaciens]|uniref:PLC-like phosphodiesterase n=1 Tax=Naganishia liquefaciens TaxID=104408 RepID=A0A8H3TUM8_9TREE|nr:hypothetical protein NliqN6_3776 [Naganishia liquefaciens]